MTGKVELEGTPFVVKTYQLVSDPNNENHVTWGASKDSFVILKPIEFAHEVLPKYFKHNNFCSFIRQLNTYGFHKVDGQQWEFKHQLFKQSEPHLLKEIKRRLSKKREAQEIPNTPETPDKVPALQTPSAPSPEQKPSPGFNFAPPGNEDGDDEVEKLKGINTILMKEIIRLQQQQETTQTAIKRILDELIESKKNQISLQEKVENLTAQIQIKNQFELEQNINQFQMLQRESNLGFDLSNLELTPELELNMANILHITPPASPFHNVFVPASPVHVPASPLQPPLFVPPSPQPQSPPQILLPSEDHLTKF